MIRNVLLDLDETILDFHKAERIALARALDAVGIKPVDAVLDRYKEINLMQWKRLELGELTKQQVKISRFELLFEQFGIDVSPSETARYYEEMLAEGHFFIEGAWELLQSLYGKYRLYIVSNGSKKVQDGRIKSAGIAPFFEQIFVSEDLGYNKPDVRFFDACFAQIPDLEKDETVIVGDSLTSDIRGGLNAGIHTIWFRRNDTAGFGEICPEYEVVRLAQIPELLKRIS